MAKQSGFSLADVAVRPVRDATERAAEGSLDGQTPLREVLARGRGHWEIENRVHYVRDFSYDEDRGRIRRAVCRAILPA